MFKRQATVRNTLAVTIVSALFLSLSAHAGLLGAGGVATGASGALVGGATGRLGAGAPMPAMATPTLTTAPMSNIGASAAAAAAAQASGQSRVQAMLPARTAGAVQQAGQLGTSGAGRIDANGIVAGSAAGNAASALSSQASASPAVAVPNGEDITLQAERLKRRGSATGNMGVSAAGSAQASNGSASVAGNGSASASGGFGN